MLSVSGDAFGATDGVGDGGVCGGSRGRPDAAGWPDRGSDQSQTGEEVVAGYVAFASSTNRPQESMLAAEPLLDHADCARMCAPCSGKILDQPHLKGVFPRAVVVVQDAATSGLTDVALVELGRSAEATAKILL